MVEDVSEDLKYLAQRSDIPLDKIEERVDRVSRIIRRRIGEEVVLVGIGSAGKEELQRMTTCLRSRGLKIEPRKISIVEATKTSYGRVSLPDDQSIEGINPNGRPIVLFDHSIGSGDTVNGTLKWALENAETLNLDTVSFLALRDETGFANMALNPSFVPEYKGPRTSFLERLQHDPDLQQKLRERIERHVNGEVYTFGRDPNWEHKTKCLTSPPVFGHNLSKHQALEILNFINGVPTICYISPSWSHASERGIDLGVLSTASATRSLLEKLEIRASYQLFFSDGDRYREESISPLFYMPEIKQPNHLRKRRLNNRSLDVKESQIDTDTKILIIDDLGTEAYLQLAKNLTQQGYRDATNFRFVTVDPFRMYTIVDLFREAFDSDLHLTPEDLGNDVEEYVRKELESGQIPERYRGDLRVVTDRSARVYGLGLALALGGNRESRYLEIGNNLDGTRLPTGPIHHVTLDRVKEFSKQ